MLSFCGLCSPCHSGQICNLFQRVTDSEPFWTAQTKSKGDLKEKCEPFTAAVAATCRKFWHNSSCDSNCKNCSQILTRWYEAEYLQYKCWVIVAIHRPDCQLNIGTTGMAAVGSKWKWRIILNSRWKWPKFEMLKSWQPDNLPLDCLGMDYCKTNADKQASTL